MFRSLMTIIRELYLYLTKVIFLLKHLVKLRRYIYIYIYKHIYINTYYVMWQHTVERHVCCVLCRISLCTAHNTRHSTTRCHITIYIYI